ncbi:hypothetical protein DMC30DRAFT_450081 [Rhodotorula diobovata]|uniref:NFACT RNA-binding domain-containing protein n=1 Tax=Rhodotorula diobovata TaxID=5288 RepID=A0A5C5FMI2_9BASI|nr:hypothetical protein DMC30DRAFT_450081 [Rhodotorula diobovata]
MVLFFSSTALGDDKPVVIYAGKDKFENEELLKYFIPEQDIWVHVDKLSSPHIYLRMPEGMDWEKIPEKLLLDAGHLCKAGSIQALGVTIIYTPATNILKRGDFATGAVTFHDARKVRRFRIEERENAIVNRLNKTKREVKVDHEAERIARDSARQRAKRLAATEARNAELATVRARKAEIEARSYDRIHGDKGTDTWEEDQWEASRKEGDYDPNDDFM